MKRTVILYSIFYFFLLEKRLTLFHNEPEDPKKNIHTHFPRTQIRNNNSNNDDTIIIN